MKLRVGGLAIEVSAGPGVPPFDAAPADGKFVSGVDRDNSDEPVDLRLEAELADLSREAPSSGDGPGGKLWTETRADGQTKFSLRTPDLGDTPYKVAAIHEGWRSGRVLLNRSFFAGQATANPLAYPLDELLFVHLLSRNNGVELHSCGVAVDGDRGFVFAGQSGDGKTTMARLWAKEGGARVLSDDRVILRYEAGTYWVYGTPWHGEATYAENARVPLSALFILGRSPSNRFIPLSPAEAVALLFARAIVPFREAEAVESVLGFLSDLVMRVPCEGLDFVPSAAVCGEVVSRFDGGSRQ